MNKTRQMQERDKRIFGEEIRDSVYRGEDKSLLGKGEMGAVEAKYHGARILLGKFSTFNLSYLTPTQRKILLEELKYMLSLGAAELNEYLTAHYSEEDMHDIWLMSAKASKRTRKRLDIKRPNMKVRKRNIAIKQRRKLTPEQTAAKVAKAKATRERNKNDPNYVSYDTLKREFIRTQKLIVKRHETKLRQAVAVYSNDTIKKQVHYKTKRLELETQHLKEYIRQNGLPLPGTKAAKMRREELRRNSD